MRGRPVSRILSKGLPPMDDHSSGRPVAKAPQAANPDRGGEAPRMRSLFGIAPGGACHATPVAGGAVGSYPTVSPLLRQAERFVFCGAFRRIAPPGRYPAPLLQGVRTFLEPPLPKTPWPAVIQPSAPRGPKRSASSGQARASAAAMAQSVGSSGPLAAGRNRKRRVERRRASSTSG